MSDLGPTVIRSKLQVPAPSGLLHRSRLCDAIEQGLERKLTLISAPAGYGKTSALVDFYRHTSFPVCWYTVDERDRDLGLFIRYIIEALRERFRGFGEQAREALASRGGELFRDPTAVVGELVNEMLDLDTEFVLVLDNFESIEGAFGVREFIHRWLDVLPLNCHLMIGSRVLPDVPVTQLVAKRQLIGLTERDLRFEPGEIVALLRGSKIEISESQAEVVARNAEGWVTGILLLSDLLREDAGSVIASTGKVTSQTYGYLASEVLNRQPWEIRRFLRVSSILREMSVRLCRDILDIEGARFLLDEVERRNLFITRFGGERRASYRYHNLFRDFLQEHLRQQEPALHAQLHQRAGEWFERDHQAEEAIHHYLTAETYARATALMERVALEWFTRGRIETLLRWADALPRKTKSHAPRLLLYQSKALTDCYEYDRAREALAYAEEGFARGENTDRLARVHIQLATLDLFESRYDEAITEAGKALEMLGSRRIPERGHAQRLVGRAYLGQGRFAQGTAELQEALALYREVGSPYDVVNILQDLTFAFASRGRFDDAAFYLNEALPIARQLESPTLLAGVLNNLGMLHLERGDYERALSLHQDGLIVARRSGDTRNEAHLADGMATIYRDAGVYPGAESLYDVAWRIARDSRPDEAIEILAARADMYRWRGDRRRALALLEQANRISVQRGLDASRRGVLALGRGIALAESGEVTAGVELVSDAVEFLEQQGAKRSLARGLFLLAKATLLAGERSQAIANLRRAMRLADEIGTIQFAVAEGQHAEDLVELGLTEGIRGSRQVSAGIERLRAFGRGLTQDLAQPKKELDRRLEIYALGEGRVVRDGRLIPGSAWQAAMARELFFYILLHGPIERDVVGLVFWPDLPADKVTSNFHSTLYRVRRAVGSETVVVKNGQYQLGDVDYWCDVEEFESLVERARLLPPHDWQAAELWQRAVDLYRGDFLMEVDRPWCIPKREALRAAYVEAIIGIGRGCEARRAFREAVTWYRRALETDKLREDVHRRIMHCLAEAGRRSKALAQFQRCREILNQELGIEPAPETIALYEEIAEKR